MCCFKCDLFGDRFQDSLTAYCKQRISQLYFERRISYGNMTKVLATEGFRVSKRMVWATIQKYKTHGMISHLPGSGRPFKLLDAIEEQMKQNAQRVGHGQLQPSHI